MNVAAVQQHFRDLAAFLTAAVPKGTKSAADDLRAVAQLFEPFKDKPLDWLIPFLQQAEEYHRTKILPVVPTKAAKPRATKTPKVVGPTPDELIRRVLALWENATREDLTTPEVEDTLKLVDQLKGKPLDELAVKVLVGGKAKGMKVQQKKDAIKNSIRERRGMTQRPGF